MAPTETSPEPDGQDPADRDPVDARRSVDHEQRLEIILRRVDAHGLDALSDRSVEDLGKLYRAAATRLAHQRAFGASVRRTEHLNRLVSRAHAVVYGSQARAKLGWRGWLRWAWLQTLAFPATVRATWPCHALAGLLLISSWIYGYHGAAAEPDWALEFLFPGDHRTPYATTAELLETLHTGRDGQVGSGSKAMFAAMLWQNNTRVALLSFFLGFAGGVPTALLLLTNGVHIGTYTYTFTSKGLAYEWWAWILPHGITELLAIVLLAGGGFWIGHLLLNPGDRSRAAAFRETRGDLVRLVAFAFPMLFVAGLIESFVRQSGLPDPARYAFAAATAAFWIGYLGFVRPSLRSLQAATAPVTVARRVVPLPTDEELLGLAFQRRPR